MNVFCPDKEGLRAVFGLEAELSALDKVPRALQPRLAELQKLTAAGAKLTLARDREGIIVGIVEGEEGFESLCFAEDGRVAHGGVSQPLYVATVEDLPPF